MFSCCSISCDAPSKEAHLVLAFAWNPLLAIEVAGSGHIDIVGALLLVVSAAALVRRWRATAAVALGLAIAVKFLPVVLLPLYWKRVRIRDAALAAVVVALLYVPFLEFTGRIPIGSLGTYVQSFRFNGPVFAALDQSGASAVAGWAGSARRISDCNLAKKKTRNARVVSGAICLAHGSILLCAPVVFPWYLLWLLPFLTSASTLLIIIWTVSIIPVYVQWHLRALGRPWGALPGWVMLLEYGCLAAAGAMIALRRLTRPEAPRYLKRLFSQPIASTRDFCIRKSGGSSNTTSVQFTEERLYEKCPPFNR